MTPLLPSVLIEKCRYMSYFFELAGMSDANAFSVSVGLTGAMLFGCICGWFLVEKLGRRRTTLVGMHFSSPAWSCSLYLIARRLHTGCVTLDVSLFLIGGLAIVGTTPATWATAGLMGVWSVVHQGTVGSASWPIMTEVTRSTLRGHTLALVTMTQGVATGIWGFALPYAVNPDEGSLEGKIGFIFGSILFASTIGVYWYYPCTYIQV